MIFWTVSIHREYMADVLFTASSDLIHALRGVEVLSRLSPEVGILLHVCEIERGEAHESAIVLQVYEHGGPWFVRHASHESLQDAEVRRAALVRG